jgi:putative endonuclease
MRGAHTYLVYILASASRRIYIGVTNNLTRRMWQHRTKAFPGFTADYNITALVFYETATNSTTAISPEKQLKAGVERRRSR